MEFTLRTNVYVDGFNLYYGALRKTPYRWLNPHTLFQLMLPKNSIQDIKYFTALVTDRPSDLTQSVRQQLFFRALGTVPNISLHLGHFLTHEVSMPMVMPRGQPQQYVKVIKTEEKGSDVNLATQLLHDAHLDRFDIAVVVSNDSDLLAPIKIVRNELGKKVGVLNPQKHPSRAILPHIDFIKQIRSGALQAAQFPDQLTDRHGVFMKPQGW
jgi:NYN domain